MHVTIAQLPEPPEGQDRVFTTDNAVIVMDGATAFEPVAETVDTVTYVEHLGRTITHRLEESPEADLRDLLAEGIAVTRDELGLTIGQSPTSTVSIARVGNQLVDILVLGDSPIVVGRPDGSAEQLVDDRVDDVAPDIRAEYRSRLAAGAGFDDEHRRLLRRLQQAQRSVRNQREGFYIAEADPTAAHQATVNTYARREVDWVILQTDGTVGPLTELGLNDWVLVAEQRAELVALLEACVEWELMLDPSATLAPRAKRSDDKTLVVVQVG